ncbi:MAG: hypothetical protein AB1490_03040 [Pseudomonadota bacterium]
MPNSEALKQRARNCEQLATDAERPADRASFRRMAEARKSLANLETWQEGKEKAFKKSA